MSRKSKFKKPEIPSWYLKPGVPFERFSALIPPDGFERVEATVPGLASPNHDFRRALIGILWRFYHGAREADATVGRAALKYELHLASLLAATLKTSVERLAKSREPPVAKALGPFACMLDERGQHQSGGHPSGIDLVGALDKFEKSIKQADRSTRGDFGGPRPAAAFALLIKGLAEWRRTWAHEHTHGRGSGFKFLSTIVDVLREMEVTLENAEREIGLLPTRFKLPNSPDALRRRMSPRASRKARRQRQAR
jgi:hypothetical protein